MFCFHKYGEIKDGYQLCKKCGRARVVPCNHRWEKYLKINDVMLKGQTGELLKCSKCGERKKISLLDYEM